VLLDEWSTLLQENEVYQDMIEQSPDHWYLKNAINYCLIVVEVVYTAPETPTMRDKSILQTTNARHIMQKVSTTHRHI